MCGRYVTVSEIKIIEKKFNVSTPQPELFKPNTNVSAGERAPVITNQHQNALRYAPIHIQLLSIVENMPRLWLYS